MAEQAIQTDQLQVLLGESRRPKHLNGGIGLIEVKGSFVGGDDSDALRKAIAALVLPVEH